jgi:hypothetical protein
MWSVCKKQAVRMKFWVEVVSGRSHLADWHALGRAFRIYLREILCKTKT